ncbi:MAG: hypothetical protein GX650_04430, partial [Clostridiales bacterium]|nr:hypothetical protein [Clostridiales bacterium]
MIHLLPEPKRLIQGEGKSAAFDSILLEGGVDIHLEIAALRLWNYPDIAVHRDQQRPRSLCLALNQELDDPDYLNEPLFLSQGYQLQVEQNRATLRFASRAGYINGMTTL